jgi:hypothetical protein
MDWVFRQIVHQALHLDLEQDDVGYVRRPILLLAILEGESHKITTPPVIDADHSMESHPDIKSQVPTASFALR